MKHVVARSPFVRFLHWGLAELRFAVEPRPGGSRQGREGGSTRETRREVPCPFCLKALFTMGELAPGRYRKADGGADPGLGSHLMTCPHCFGCVGLEEVTTPAGSGLRVTRGQH